MTETDRDAIAATEVDDAPEEDEDEEDETGA